MRMMDGKPMDPMDAKKRAIEELMAHLDNRDGRDLGDAMKPKGVGVEVTKIEGLPKDGSEPDSDDSPGMLADASDDSKPKMSDEEMAELIEALQSKLGA